jgi:hypothetical protein
MPDTNFFWDPLSDNILQERDETGAVTAEYTTEPGLYGNLLSQNRGGTESQYHFDVLGSTLALTDDNQQVTDTYAYTAFGERTERTGSTINPFQFIAEMQYYSNELAEAYDARGRLMAARDGRWLSCADVFAVIADSVLPICDYVYTPNQPSTLWDATSIQSAEIGYGNTNAAIRRRANGFSSQCWTNGDFASQQPDEASLLKQLLLLLSAPPLPCGAVELTSDPPHSVLLPIVLPKGQCPAPSGIRFKIREEIENALAPPPQGLPFRRQTGCPEGCMCIVAYRQSIPMSVPLVIVRRFCWIRRFGVLPVPVPCTTKGRRGPCWIVAFVVVRAIAHFEIGYCK